ncbi:MAG: chromate transporter [Capsulimonadales bacterium]|nr:chromate transporter [Capsulimonadales bacterium]
MNPSDPPNPWTFFLLALKASLFSTGGMGNVPSLHGDLIGRGWATEREFAESLAVGQISPGPNGLWVVGLGYLLDGLRGALLALLAICLPPLLVLAVEHFYRRVENHPAVVGFVSGLSLAVVGVFVIVLWKLLQGNGLDPFSVSMVAVSILLAATRRVPVAAVVGFGALAGIVADLVRR